MTLFHPRHFLVPCLAGFLAAAPAEPGAPLYSVVLTSGSTQALSYPFVEGSTRIGFRGTPLASGAGGEAFVRAAGGRMRIRAHFKGLAPAQQFGPEFLTYVLWSITPMGRPANLGEVLPGPGGRARIEAQTHLQTFALVVTAEPHFAVTRMSHAVVLENVQGRRKPPVENIEARFDLLQRGSYSVEPGAGGGAGDRRVSPYVFQARNAVRIAQGEQADSLAPSEFQAAADQLSRLDAMPDLRRKGAVALARRIIQQAEDARLVAEKQREIRAQARLREQAEEARTGADAARREADAARAAASQEAVNARRQARAANEAARSASEAQLAVRRSLLAQLNNLLRTRETGEGLLATLTEVAFPSGRSTLSVPARENLAKVAGILLAHPGLTIKVLGHTDSTGQPAFNQRLSQDRAESVRLFLLQQGLPFGSIAGEGLGSSRPVAANGTPEGRSRNRRVDLIVAGEAIGL